MSLWEGITGRYVACACTLTLCGLRVLTEVHLLLIFLCRAHAAELGNVVPAEPLLFLKPTTSYVEEGGAVVVRRVKQHK